MITIHSFGFKFIFNVGHMSSGGFRSETLLTNTKADAGKNISVTTPLQCFIHDSVRRPLFI